MIILSRNGFALLLLTPILFSGCAEVAGPPGGPKDETAPSVISTIPLNNSVNTPINNKISIEFSESIEKKSIESALFITPRQGGDLVYKWKKNILTVTLPDSFEDSKTYVVNVGANVRDIRGNRLDNSYSFAFSTGEKIDRGEVTGSIFQDNKPKAGISVGLFDYSIIDSIKLLDSIYPPYMTQSGKEGEFSLEYLPYGKYLLLAYEDKNKNLLLNYPAEEVGLPDDFINLADSLVISAVNINLFTGDTSRLSIVSAVQAENKLIKIRLTQPLSEDMVRADLHNILLESSEDSYIASSVKESGGKSQSSFQFYFANIRDNDYRLIWKWISELEGRADTILLESPVFTYSQKADSSLPQVEYFSLAGKEVFPENLSFEFGFSEPMSRDGGFDSAVMIYDADDMPEKLSLAWIDDFRLRCLTEELPWGGNYFVVLKQNRFADASGNLLGDSIMVYNFSTYDQDSLGEVSGGITFETPKDSGTVPYLTISSIDGKNQFTEIIADNQFRFKIPPGKYQLSGFLDENNNGKYDPGSLIPFRFAEKMVLSDDTIRVRSRFETSGLEFEF